MQGTQILLGIVCISLGLVLAYKEFSPDRIFSGAALWMGGLVSVEKHGGGGGGQVRALTDQKGTWLGLSLSPRPGGLVAWQSEGNHGGPEGPGNQRWGHSCSEASFLQVQSISPHCCPYNTPVWSLVINQFCISAFLLKVESAPSFRFAQAKMETSLPRKGLQSETDNKGKNGGRENRPGDCLTLGARTAQPGIGSRPCRNKSREAFRVARLVPKPLRAAASSGWGLG